MKNLHKLSQIIKTTLENQPSLLLIHLMLIGFFRLKNDINVDNRKMPFYESRILSLNCDSNLASICSIFCDFFLNIGLLCFSLLLKVKSKIREKMKMKSLIC